MPTPSFHDSARWSFWADRGGTFTDLVWQDPTGRSGALKLPSSSAIEGLDPIVLGIRELLGLIGDQPIPVDQVEQIRVGTTVATNALLERRGAACVLVISRGFADLPLIGSQERPQLFALAIERPPPLQQWVVEADERLSVNGQVLQPLDTAALLRALQQARRDGAEACAIALLHGWRYPGHELAAEAVARQAGFAQVSLSHRVCGQPRLLPRADTTVADAYLSPVLRQALDRLARQLPGLPLQVMQSSGGLCRADAISGADAVLSGPAGGVVSSVAIARLHGCSDVIGFDMGGTSTDVCHWSGETERRAQARIGGVRIRRPMLEVHTVAAGGGSIVHADGGRLRVGPRSAGARPGPACYGHGGPATLTDANLLLGRLFIPRFPQRFGADGRSPLNADAAAASFAAICAQFGDATDDSAILQLAEGARQLANEAMASAIRRISVERGHDLARHTLVAFGGAGGQHACAVAERLGIRRVLLHPLAGVQSAWGIGLAREQAIRQRALELDLAAADAASTLADAIAELWHQAAQALGRPDAECSVEAALRYRGADNTLDLPLEPHRAADHCSALIQRFHLRHRQRYGFSRLDTAVELATLRVIAAQPAAPPAAPSTIDADASSPPMAIAHHRLWQAHGWQALPVYERRDLRPGQQRVGPALIVDDTATHVLEAGWTLRTLDDLTLELTSCATAAPQPESTQQPDPVRLELFHRLFMDIAERMGLTLEQTSASVNIRERLDFSCALFDAQGQLIANAPHMPVHLGSMSDAVRHVRELHGHQLRCGDAYAHNAPFSGGTHLPDITVISPVFLDAADPAPSFWVAARGHHADIGGISPGSMPPASTHIDDEGLVIDGLLIARNGVMHDAELRQLLGTGAWPARNIEQNLADLRAQIAANHCGEQALRDSAARHGRTELLRYAGWVLDDAESAVRAAVRRLQGGQFRTTMDNGAVIQVKLSIDAGAGTARIDFSGSSAQRHDNFNAPRAVTKAAVLYVFRCLIDRDIPLNDGCLRPLDIVIEAGSMLDPRHPAAVVAGNVETSQIIVDCLFAALGLMAAAQGSMNNLSLGNTRYQYYETLCGGAGAGPGFAGASAVHTHMTNSRLTDPEILEARYPLRVQQFAIRHGSGGDGRWRGGDGVIREFCFLQAMQVAMLANRRRTRPFGLAGGGDAACAIDMIIGVEGQPRPLPASGQALLAAGESLRVMTAGGGGYGAPTAPREGLGAAAAEPPTDAGPALPMLSATAMQTLQRCPWCLSSPEYIAYHDDEWGRPCHDETTLFAFLNLEGAQAGLSWRTILNKRHSYAQAFDQWDASRIARYDDADVARLLADPGIVRNRLKVQATIANARAVLELRARSGGLQPWLWQWVDGKPLINHWATLAEVPAHTELSDRISRELKRLGFRFVGSTIIYAWLQAMGVVNDHLLSCHRHPGNGG